MNIEEQQPETQRDNHGEFMETDDIEHYVRNPHSDLLESMLERDEPPIQDRSRTLHHHKSEKHVFRGDMSKILNSSNSTERIQACLHSDMSQEGSSSSRKADGTQNSNEESFQHSFQKKHESSFSVENTIRDSSSSMSERSDNTVLSFIAHAEQPQERKPQTPPQLGIPRQGTCNCRRSRCLKMYCQCFSQKLYCGNDCMCYDCGNQPGNAEMHFQAVIGALARNVNSFQEDVDENQNKLRNQNQSFTIGIQKNEVKKGCKCRRTHCIKKYCECFHSGQSCGIFCRCEDCKNRQSADV